MLHDDELAVTDELARALIDSQLPQLAKLKLTRLPLSGSSNVLFRLGGEFLARFPRQRGGSADIAKEATYGPLLAPHLSVTLPNVVAIGEASLGYPEAWSVVRWIDGERPTTASADLTHAVQLAQIVGELRAAPLPPDACSDTRLQSYRAQPLRQIDAEIRGYLAACRDLPNLDLDLDACDRFWTAAMNIADPPVDAAKTWVHADLLAENILVDNGRIVALLDLGALSIGRPSVDLAGAWELFNADARDAFRACVDVDAAEWARGQAWAFAIAIMTFPYYWHTMPARCADRLATVHAVLADYAPG